MQKYLLKIIVIIGLLFGSVFLLIKPLDNIVFNNSNWLDKNHPVEIQQNYVDKVFKQNESLLITIKLEKNYFTNSVIQTLNQVYQKLNAIQGIKKIRSPLHLKTSIKHNDTIEIRTYESALKNKILLDLKAYRQDFYENDYLRRFLNKKEDAFLLMLDIPVSNEDNFQLRNFLIKEIRQVLDKSAFSNYFFAGDFHLNYILDKKNRDNLYTLIPIAIFVLILLIYIFFRNFFVVFISVSIAIVCILLSLNLFVLLDKPISILALSLFLLLFSIAISDSLHIFGKWQHTDSIKTLFSQSWKPCLVTSLTSAFGFSLFYVSALIPLKNLAMVGVISILLSYVLVVGMTIIAILLLPQYAKSSQQKQFIKLQTIMLLMKNYPKQIKRTVLSLFIIVIIAMPFAFFESNMLDVFFAKNSKTYQNYHYIDKELGGTGSLNLVLEAPQKEAFKEINKFQTLLSFKEKSSKLSNVLLSYSYDNPIKMVHQDLSNAQNSVPQTSEELAQEILFLEFSRNDSDDGVLASYVNFDFNKVRIEFNTSNLNTHKIKSLLKEIKGQLSKTEFKKIKTFFAGSSYYFYKLSSFVIETQILSTMISLLALFIFLWVFYNAKFALIGLVINAFPLMLVTALMIILRQPFDLSTVLISSICLAIAVDNSIHLIDTINKQSSLKWSSIFKQKLPILTLVLVLFLLSFLTFAFSDLVLLRNFGLYSAIMLLLSWLSNFILLPILYKIPKKT